MFADVKSSSLSKPFLMENHDNHLGMDPIPGTGGSGIRRWVHLVVCFNIPLPEVDMKYWNAKSAMISSSSLKGPSLTLLISMSVLVSVNSWHGKEKMKQKV